MARRGNKPIQIRMEPEIHVALEAAAEAAGLTRTALARRMIEQGLAPRSARQGGAVPPGAPKAPRQLEAQPRAEAKCLHPIGRRIGDRCAQCGALVTR